MNRSVVLFLLPFLCISAAVAGIGCQKTITNGPESPPSEVVTVGSKTTESMIDDDKFDVRSAMKETGEAMLARNYEKAIELLDKAINECGSKKKSDTETLAIFLLNITYCHVMLGSDEKGIPYIERACQLMPENDYIIGGYGCVFHRLKRYDEAIEQYQKAIELRKKANPYFFSAEEQGYCWNLFMAYNNKGDLRNAYDTYKKIVSRLKGYQFHVEQQTKDLVQYLAGINDDNWETMPRFRIVKKLPPHPQEEKVASNSEDESRIMRLNISVYTELIDDAPK